MTTAAAVVVQHALTSLIQASHALKLENCICKKGWLNAKL